jgi:hypothetical protein
LILDYDFIRLLPEFLPPLRAVILKTRLSDNNPKSRLGSA